MEGNYAHMAKPSRKNEKLRLPTPGGNALHKTKRRKRYASDQGWKIKAHKPQKSNNLCESRVSIFVFEHPHQQNMQSH